MTLTIKLENEYWIDFLLESLNKVFLSASVQGWVKGCKAVKLSLICFEFYLIFGNFIPNFWNFQEKKIKEKKEVQPWIMTSQNLNMSTVDTRLLLLWSTFSTFFNGQDFAGPAIHIATNPLDSPANFHPVTIQSLLRKSNQTALYLILIFDWQQSRQ